MVERDPAWSRRRGEETRTLRESRVIYIYIFFVSSSSRTHGARIRRRGEDPREAGLHDPHRKSPRVSVGPSSSDRTVSRRHLSLRHDEFELQFEVIGRNPIVVRSANGGGDRVYRNSEKGELKRGDRVSLSLKTPFFWVVRRVGGRGEEGEVDRAVLDAVERREKRTLERRRRREEEEAARAPIYGGEVDDEVFNAGLESDLAHLDLPKLIHAEFGFIVMGHEFDNYPKQKIRPMKSWNWYLEEPREKNSDEEEEQQPMMKQSL
uniref:FHA domain-containing protein n=1 Tax=Ananas comosus var. bracteatus TaxID=296719 RepID=A0A6V7QQ07_ANACO